MQIALAAVLPSLTEYEIGSVARYGITGSSNKPRREGRAAAVDLGSDPIHVEFFLKSLGHAIEQMKRDLIAETQEKQSALIDKSLRDNLRTISGAQALKETKLKAKREKDKD